MAYCKQVLQNATNGYDKVLGDQLRKDPTLLVSAPLAVRENVLHHKAAYPGVWNNKICYKIYS